MAQTPVLTLSTKWMHACQRRLMWETGGCKNCNQDIGAAGVHSSSCQRTITNKTLQGQQLQSAVRQNNGGEHWPAEAATAQGCEYNHSREPGLQLGRELTACTCTWNMLDKTTAWAKPAKDGGGATAI